MGHDFGWVPDRKLSVFHTGSNHAFGAITICLPPGDAIEPTKGDILSSIIDE